MLHRHPLGPEVAEISVHGSVHDSSGPQRYQFVPGLRSGRHRSVRNVLTCDDRRSGRCPTAANGAVELQPHKQRETVPIGLVELSPYRVNLTSVGWRRTAHMNRRQRIQLIGVLTSSVSSTWTSPRFMLSTMPTAHVGCELATDLGGLAIPQPKFDWWSRLQRTAARNTRHRYGHCSGWTAFSKPMACKLSVARSQSPVLATRSPHPSERMFCSSPA